MPAAGLDLRSLPVFATASGSRVSNMPAVRRLIPFLAAADPFQWYTLALSSTFARHLILPGSIGNLIVVEQASLCGIRASFREHAAVGLPVTALSLVVPGAWIAVAVP